MNKYCTMLELNKILAEVSALAHSVSGANFVNQIVPCASKNEAEHELNLTEEAVLAITIDRATPSFNFDMLGAVAEKLKVKMSLTLGELLRVGRCLKCARLAKSSIDHTPRERLKAISSSLITAKELEDVLERSILSDSELSDSASDKLYSIRRKIRNINDSIKSKLFSYVKSTEYTKYLQENIITMRSGRYVIPVKQEHKGNVQGLIHDQSASGATVFIEPIAIVEHNNELKLLLLEEENEINRIIAELSQRCASVLDGLVINEQVLTVLDSIFAKANYALNFRAIKPSIINGHRVKITRGRHPLLGNKSVPLELDLDKPILLISGPNAGGKTVALKTVGLFALMLACGLFLPCDDAEIPFFDQVFCDMGDEQSIENALSTFSSHITNLKLILDGVTPSSLVLLDEVGGGTDPLEGSALAIAIVRYLIRARCTAIVTTHYYELKEFALENSSISNASMQFDSKTFRPTYRLLTGLPGSSNALAISRHIGLNEEILTDALSLLSAEKLSFENTLRVAETVKADAEAELVRYKEINERLTQELVAVQRERDILTEANEKIKRNAKAEARLKIASYMQEADELITQLKDKLTEESEKALFEARQLNNKLKDVLYHEEQEEELETAPLDPERLKVGDRVVINKHKMPAKILNFDVKKNEARVSAGNMILTVKLDELSKDCTKEVKAKKEQQKTAPKPVPVVAQPPMREIKLLGHTVEDAIFVLDEFLPECQSASVREVKIVHGVGTGALRRGVQQYLKGHYIVDSFRIGKSNEGGLGVTIAMLKE